MKRFIRGSISTITVAAFLAGVPLQAVAEGAGAQECAQRMGCIPETRPSEEWTVPDTEIMSFYATTPSSVDLSESVYFPAIGDQGDYGSCVSWATTYYQFTYEAHKLNGVITTPANTYSPSWTFNWLNRGVNEGAQYSDAYKVLQKQGAVTLHDMPYNGEWGHYDFSWCNNTQAMLDALKTRVSAVHTTTITLAASGNNVITSPTDSQLTNVKQILSSGKLLTVTISGNNELTNWSVKAATNGENAVYRASDKDIVGDHALTIVGYDDNIQCDINGDGVISNSEKGAFKIANSWGTDWDLGNNGYIWIMYDALNVKSANTSNNWESQEPGNRVRIFNCISPYASEFYYIDVANQEVNLVGQIAFTTPHDRYFAEFITARGTGSRIGTAEQYSPIYKSDQELDIDIAHSSFSGTMVLDFGTLDDDIMQYLTGNNWFVRFDNGGDYNYTNVSAKITDNKNNTIHNFGTIATSLTPGFSTTKSVKLNLQLGDVDYDGSLTDADARKILTLAASLGNGVQAMSDLQTHIGDYNQDGVVNAVDASLIRAALPAAEAAAFDAFLEEEYQRISGTAMYAADADSYEAAYAQVIAEVYELTR